MMECLKEESVKVMKSAGWREVDFISPLDFWGKFNRLKLYISFQVAKTATKTTMLSTEEEKEWKKN